MDQFLLDFINESIFHIESVEKNLIRLETTSEFDDVINEVFRNAHTVKGGASFFGFSNIVKLGHSMENIFDKLRSLELELSSDLLDVLLDSNDKLREMLQNIEQEDTYNVEENIEKIEELTTQKVKKTKKKATKKKKEEPLSATAALDADEDFQALIAAALKEQKSTKQKKKTKTKEKVVPVKKVEPKANNNVKEVETLRVNANVINNLMDITGELILAKNTLLINIEEDEFNPREFSNKLEWLVDSLHSNVLEARLQKIGAVFDKFPRIVRDLSKSLSKKINLSITGSNVELDRDIIETLQDPLTHLIRNSLDHGIESPEDRVTAGKPEKGNVTLTARALGESVVVEIVDDGAGINPEKISQIALKKDVITQEQLDNMSDLEKINLIFLPGFSSKEEASNISGRGVGMDVVKTSIEKMKGTIVIDSKVGYGSKFIIRLPLTVAIMPGMKVELENNQFIIAEADIKELIMVKNNEDRYFIEQIEDNKYLNIRKQMVPILDVPELLGVEIKKEIYKYVIVEDINTFALPVSNIIGKEDIIVKPLPKLIDNTNYSGTTILGSGDIVPVLSIENLVKNSPLKGVKVIHKKDNKDKKKVERKMDYLNFKICNEDNYLIPISYIERVARVDESLIQENCGRLYYPIGEKVYNLFDFASIDGMNLKSNKEYFKTIIVMKEEKNNIAFISDRIKGNELLSVENTQALEDKMLKQIVKTEDLLHVELDVEEILKFANDNIDAGGTK